MDKLLYETGFGIVPKALMCNPDISSEAKCLFNYFAAFAGNGDSAFPSINLIKHHLGWGNDRYYRARKELINNGYLEVTQIKENGKFAHNIYKLHHTPITCFQKSDDEIKEDRKLKETDIKKTDNNIYIASKEKEIYDYWNNKRIIVHKQLTDKIKKAINKALKEYSLESIEKAISNYKTILDSNFKYTYKFTLERFLNQSNGISRFVDEEGDIWINYLEANDLKNETAEDVKEVKSVNVDEIISSFGIGIKK